MWIVIIIVCAIFGFLIQPIDRYIKKRVSSLWLRYVLELIVYFALLMALYGLAALFGFNIWK